MKARNIFIPATGDKLIRLEEEYAMLGRHVRRVEGGLVLMAYPPKKVKKKPERRDSKRREDETAPPKNNPREQRPKRS